MFEVTVSSITNELVTDVVLEFRCEGIQSGIVEHRLVRPLAPYERLDPIVIGIMLESAGVMPMTVHIHASTGRGRCTGRGNVRPLDQPGVTILERPADLQSFKLEIKEKAFFGAIIDGVDLAKFSTINDLIGAPLNAPVEGVKLDWDGFPVAPTLKAGLMFGPFRLVRRLGGGGMGVVWEAQDTSLKNKVIALKFLPEEVCYDPGAIDDLRDEVLKARDLSHENIVRIYHIHEQDGTAAISMEYIEGSTLDDLRRKLPNKVFEAADLQLLLPSLCNSLDYAHRPPKPLIHHDIKPLNLMLTKDGKLKVCDFGLAGSLCETKSKLSGRNHSTSGTTPYMSPQHLLLGSRLISDDVYALGATLYELLTSKPPFYAGNIEAQIERIPPTTMAERRRVLGITDAKPIPAAWERAVAACLAKEPQDRPQSAGAVLAMCDDVSPLEDGAINKPIQVTLPGKVVMKLCYCPADSFRMGSPSSEAGHRDDEEQVNVTLSKAFWLGQTEVTQAQWYALMKTTPAEQKAKGSSYGGVTGIGPNQPMYFVSWEEAQEFIGMLNCSVKLPTGWVFALPTEAQWEYACRTGSEGPYAGKLDEMAWYEKNAGSTTHEVATKKLNAWGLYDMHGNLWEWCFDAYTSKLPGGADPVVKDGSYRVVRGGCWDLTADYCRSAARNWYGPCLRSSRRGFRVAAVPAGSGATQVN